MREFFFPSFFLPFTFSFSLQTSSSFFHEEFFFFPFPPLPTKNPMAPARTRRRSSGGATAAAAATTAATPLSDGKAPPLEAGTPGSVVAVRASAGDPASAAAAAAVPYPASSTAVTPAAPFAPLGGRGDQETVIDDLPEELLLKVREGSRRKGTRHWFFFLFSFQRARRGENAARRRLLFLLLALLPLIHAVYRLLSSLPRHVPSFHEPRED